MSFWTVVLYSFLITCHSHSYWHIHSSDSRWTTYFTRRPASPTRGSCSWRCPAPASIFCVWICAEAIRWWKSSENCVGVCCVWCAYIVCNSVPWWSWVLIDRLLLPWATFPSIVCFGWIQARFSTHFTTILQEESRFSVQISSGVLPTLWKQCTARRYCDSGGVRAVYTV